MLKHQARADRLTLLISEIKKLDSQMKELDTQESKQIFFDIDKKMRDVFNHLRAATLEGCKVRLYGENLTAKIVEIATLGNRSNNTWVNYSFKPNDTQTWEGVNLTYIDRLEVIKYYEPTPEQEKARLLAESGQYVCADCGTYCDSMHEPCPRCKSRRIVVVSFCNNIFGANWYDSSFDGIEW